MKTAVAIIWLASIVSAEFPSFVKQCKRDAKLNECIKENILSAKDHLKNGIPSLFIPKYNPLVVTEEIDYSLGNLTMKLYKDFSFAGLDDFNLKNVNLDLDKNFFELEWAYKDTLAHGKYKLVGDFLKYKVDSEGICTVNTTNFGVHLKMYGDRQAKEGKTYINFNKIDSKYVLDNVKMTFYFENLFPSAEENESGNKYVNENVRAAALTFRPIVDKLIIGLHSGHIQQLFNALPIEDLFPL